MIIEQELLQCVVFIGVFHPDDGTYTICGSGFAYGHDLGNGTADPCYVVTAKHVIDQIRGRGADRVWFRVNTKDGQARWIPTEYPLWRFPIDKTVDAAACPAAFEKSDEISVFPDSWSLPKARPDGGSLLLGDDMFLAGFFSRHYGNDRNVPIVRVGSLACTTIEEIQTKAFGKTKGYLIECRSIGGLSGSPVFLNPGGKFVGNSIVFGGRPLLIGLIHGHFDDELSRDVSDDSVNGGRQVNVGIAVVTPIAAVHEFLNLTPFRRDLTIQTVGCPARLTFKGSPLGDCAR
ncbi:MAG: hypothetical protein ABMA01_04715 [Chthoniobacteraceae bacterium]